MSGMSRDDVVDDLLDTIRELEAENDKLRKVVEAAEAVNNHTRLLPSFKPYCDNEVALTQLEEALAALGDDE